MMVIHKKNTMIQQLITKYLNKKAIIKVGNLSVEVKIINVKNSYGKNRFLVEPIAGTGSVWVEKIELKK